MEMVVKEKIGCYSPRGEGDRQQTTQALTQPDIGLYWGGYNAANHANCLISAEADVLLLS